VDKLKTHLKPQQRQGLIQFGMTGILVQDGIGTRD